MTNKKEIKKQAKEDFRKDQEAIKQRKAEMSKMDAAQKKAAKNADMQAKKEAKKQRKAAIKAMNSADKKAAKKHDKYYGKLKKRPRKITVWAIVLIILAFLVYSFGPILGDFGKLLSGVDLVSGTPEAEAALSHGEEIAELISDEGIVLLKNEDNVLPLSDMKLNVFGFNAMNFRLGGGGSGGADQSRSVKFYDGLANAGIEYNTELYDYYANSDFMEQNESKTGLGQIADMIIGKETTNEPSIEYLTDEIISQAKEYSDYALIVFSSSSVEMSDAELSELKLSENQTALLEKVTENFSNVIIVINAGNALELGFLNDYPSIKAALWVGTPGSRGANSLGKVLTGEVNPSGRLVDTYVYDDGSSPASENFGDYSYTNIKGMSLMEYEEGIYVGYRYYETYYLGDEEGYSKAVIFPFGYGLSYTDFEWEVVGYEFSDETISVDVAVINTGDMAGKDVVEIYFSAPYYEGSIEKSAIELGGYAKTALLQPGETETLTISFAVRDMSSYDMITNQAYVLENGTYEIKVSKNVHDAVSVLTYEVKDDVIYSEDEVTGTDIENQFVYADGSLTYLSRSDWEGTYPTSSDMVLEAPQEVVDGFYFRPGEAEGAVPVTGADNGIMLADLKGLDYNDPMWDDYLNQFTVEEMSDLFLRGAYQTVAVERLGLPSTVLLDGPAGINFFFGEVIAASYPTEIVIASTWNDELAYMMGEAVGMEANAYGVQGWYAPGMNIHRTAQGGRNFEYFSEDPLLSGKMSANMVSGAQSKDIIVFMKHFALNEQEVNARSGIMIWANEQAIREIYLRPFEITVKEGNVTGAMSSFIHIGYKWSGGNPELLENVLRDEWGFVGVVTTDAVLGSFMDKNLAVRNGNDLMLAVTASTSVRDFNKLYNQDPVGITQGLRERTHNICYSILEYTNLVTD